MKYKRVLLKLSGEMLSKDSIFSEERFTFYAEQIANLSKKVELAIVLGGGNILRGRESKRINKSDLDSIGMLGTLMNSIMLKSYLSLINVNSIILTANVIQGFEEYSKDKAIDNLKKNKVVILSGGLNNPYFSTDTAAALKAIDIEADVLIKATKTDGVYDKDPLKDKEAKRFDKISYDEILNRKLKVMDLTAITLAMENNLKILVCNGLSNLLNNLENEYGTLISKEGLIENGKRY